MQSCLVTNENEKGLELWRAHTPRAGSMFMHPMEQIGFTCVTCIKHMVNRKCGQWAWSTQNTIFVVILAHVLDLKQSQASFLPHLTVWPYLQFAQMPTSQDLAMFVPTPTDGQTDYFTLCAYARDKTQWLQSRETVFDIIFVLCSCR